MKKWPILAVLAVAAPWCLPVITGYFGHYDDGLMIGWVVLLVGIWPILFVAVYEETL